MVNVIRIDGPFINHKVLVVEDFSIDAIKKHLVDVVVEDYDFEQVGNIIGVHDKEGDHDFFFIQQQ